MMRSLCRALLAAAALCGLTTALAAENCSQERFDAAVDAAGAELRAFNSGAQPKLNEKLVLLREKKGWSDTANEDRAQAFLFDKRMAEFDQKSGELLDKVDALGRPEPGTALDCARLAELEATSLELLAVMKAKSAYTIAKIDKELGEAPGSAKAETPSLPPPAKKPSERSSTWDTTTAHAPPGDIPPAELPGEPYAPPDIELDEQGYTIDEIREISRGFFGTISTNLASVLEYAFSKSGRPTGYVLGSEGGGAFLAGLRYGSGTLYLRSGGTEKVYWHGPSIGSDIGAEGSRSLFLVYRLKEPDGLYRRFTGIDGTAYFVGGVGITFLKGGEIIMAPIRSGLGFRLGASIGYVRFTPRPTWNPF